MADPDDTVDAVGLALTSIEHPTALGGDGSYIDYIDPSKLMEVEVEIDGELIVPQAFIVRGERQIKMNTGQEQIAATVDLVTTFKAWLAIQMPVYDWRQEPTIAIERDFATDGYFVHFTARGRLDIPTRVADHHILLVELP